MPTPRNPKIERMRHTLRHVEALADILKASESPEEVDHLLSYIRSLGQEATARIQSLGKEKAGG